MTFKDALQPKPFYDCDNPSIWHEMWISQKWSLSHSFELPVAAGGKAQKKEPFKVVSCRAAGSQAQNRCSAPWAPTSLIIYSKLQGQQATALFLRSISYNTWFLSQPDQASRSWYWWQRTIFSSVKWCSFCLVKTWGERRVKLHCCPAFSVTCISEASPSSGRPCLAEIQLPYTKIGHCLGWGEGN